MPSNDTRDHSSVNFTPEELHSLMIEYAPVAIFSTDINGEVIHANRAMKLLLGLPSGAELKKYNILQDPNANEAGIDKTFKETLETGMEATFIGPYTSPWGKELYLRLLSAPLVSHDGKVKGLLGIVEDISPQIRAQKHAERLNHLLRVQTDKLEATVRKRTAELARSEERYRTLIELMETGLWVASDKSSITTYVNPRIEEMLGYSRAEMLGRSAFDFVAPEDHEKLREIDRQRHEGHVPSSRYELTLIRKDGTPINVLFHGVALSDSKGDTIETFATITDITSRKKVEIAREAHLKHFQELEKARNEFIASVSHEFMTPISVIRGHSDLLIKGKKGPLTPQIGNSIKSILRNAKRLERLTEDLLELMRIESDTFKLDIQEFDLKQITCDICEDFAYLANARNHSLKLEIPDSISVKGDPERLSQVLGNIIENAIIYTPPGGNIVVRASSAEDGLTISVLDDGVGIPPEHQSAVFERFYSLDTSRKAKGMGIGLAVCRELIERHGGKIWIEPGLQGKGTCVSFLVPSKINE
ncbi:MAG: PAS domain S-box protein [Candidatus Thorarchaeota archaeon]